MPRGDKDRMNQPAVSIWKREFFPGLSFFRFFRWLFGWRMVRRYLFCLACLATLIAVFYAEENWRGKHAWEKYKREQEAKGEMFEWKAVIPPPVPDDQNFAMAPFFEDSRLIWEQWKGKIGPYDTSRLEHLQLEIWRTLLNQPLYPPILADWNIAPQLTNWLDGARPDLRVWQAYYRKPAIATAHPHEAASEFPVSEQPQTPAADVILALSKFADTLDKLRQAARRPYSRFPIDYENGWVLIPPHNYKLRSSGSYLHLLSAALLESRQVQPAADNVDLLFYLADSIKAEPYLYSFDIRTEILKSSALGVIWQGMAGRQWSDAQLARFQEKIEAVDLLSDCLRALRCERCRQFLAQEAAASARMDSPLARSLFLRYQNEDTTKARLERYFRFAPKGWFDQNKLFSSRLLQDTLIAAIDPKSQRVDLKLVHSFSMRIEQVASHPGPYNFCADELSQPWIWFAPEETVRAQTCLNIALVACALERYWLTNGAYPEKLDALVPRFIKKLPHDLRDGGPLKYRRSENDRFVLYAVGLDGKDSGGAYKWPNGKPARNWIWAFPEQSMIKP
jgi:hypothetical protein